MFFSFFFFCLPLLTIIGRWAYNNAVCVVSSSSPPSIFTSLFFCLFDSSVSLVTFESLNNWSFLIEKKKGRMLIIACVKLLDNNRIRNSTNFWIFFCLKIGNKRKTKKSGSLWRQCSNPPSSFFLWFRFYFELKIERRKKKFIEEMLKKKMEKRWQTTTDGGGVPSRCFWRPH